MGEDLGLERGEAGPGLEPEFTGEVRTGALVGLQCLGLPSGAVQREHELSGDGLALGMLERQDRQLVDELGVVPQLNVRLNPCLQGDEMHLLQTADLWQREVLEADLRQRRAAPQFQRRTQVRGGALRVAGTKRALSVANSGTEDFSIELAGVQRQEVAAIDTRQCDAAGVVHSGETLA